jgi:hypothetical protein
MHIKALESTKLAKDSAKIEEKTVPRFQMNQDSLLFFSNGGAFKGTQTQLK